MSRILVAGIGNIFHGDDAFGVEVVRRIGERPLPDLVDAVDFGIRAIDLTYALLDRYDAAVLVDASQRGEEPGCVSIVAPEPEEAEELAPEEAMLSPHGLDPARVLRLVRTLNGRCRRIMLVACEPLNLGGDDGGMGLSAPVARAVDAGVAAVEELIRDLQVELQLQGPVD